MWARANGCEWNEDTCSSAAHGGAPGGHEVGQGQRLQVGCVYVFRSSSWRPPGAPAVGQGQWAASGMRIRVPLQLMEATWMS